VLALQADGSAMYTVQVLWTMAREDLDITTVILNRRHQGGACNKGASAYRGDHKLRNNEFCLSSLVRATILESRQVMMSFPRIAFIFATGILDIAQANFQLPKN